MAKATSDRLRYDGSVPGKAAGEHHDVVHRTAMLAADDGSGRERLRAARRDVQALQGRDASASLALGLLFGNPAQQLDALAVEIAESIGLNTICDQPDEELLRDVLGGGAAVQTPPSPP
jgi:hypothetical protein